MRLRGAQEDVRHGLEVKIQFISILGGVNHMARIAGIDLPREKRVEIGLTYIYGIGRPLANKILQETGVSPDVRVKDLTEEQENALRTYIEHNVVVEGDLHRDG